MGEKMPPESFMRHPQFDEDFLKFESKVDDLIKYLQDVQANIDGGAEEVAARTPKARRSTNASRPSLEEAMKQSFIANETVDRSFLYKKMCNRDEEEGEEEEERKNEPFTMDQHAFMQQIEVDAKERAQARHDRQMIAKQLKTMGNEAYKKQNFEKAIDLYSKAIDTIRDSPVLYCNRALAYIKLKNYRRAVMDCDHVVNKLDEKNLRAWLYRALAYMKLEDTVNYDASVQMAYKNNNKKKAEIDEFLERIKIENV